MLWDFQYRVLTAGREKRIFLRLFTILSHFCKVTVLLFVIAGSGVVRADFIEADSINSEELNQIKQADETELNLFEFSSHFQLPMAPGRLDGVMASDGLQHRIAIYWIEPYIYRESTLFLRCGDFIVTPEAVYYWIYGMPKPGVFRLSVDSNDSLLPRVNSAEGVVRSALAIMGHSVEPLNSGIIDPNRERPGYTSNTSLEVGKFFRDSRDQAEYKYEVLPDEADGNHSTTGMNSDMQIMNALPYGREYLKVTHTDGTVDWRLRRALDGLLLAYVTIRPIHGVDRDRLKGVFDPNTLGRWTLVPEACRVYWSFNNAFTELSTSANKRVSARQLFDKLESYFADSNSPAQVYRAMDRLRFKTALETGDTNCVWHVAQAAVTGLCGDPYVDKYQCLLQLGSMSGKIDKRYPEQAEERLRPLVAKTVKHAGTEIKPDMERLMAAIERNRWFTYGKLVLAETRSQNLVDKEILNTFSARIQASCLARDVSPLDPCEYIPSVKQYMAQLDANPLKGTIDMKDVRDILEKGLAKHYGDNNSDAMDKIVDNVIKSIRLIVGEGPFCGDQEELVKSIERFSGLYLVVEKHKEPIDTILATFLALSFCDISTPEDHELLFSQFDKQCDRFQAQVNIMLRGRGLDSLVVSEDVEGLFNIYKRIFRRYIDDPLWPAFKFPLTANEEVRLNNRLKLGFEQLKTSLDEMSLMLKYGGFSEELKKQTIYEISRATQQFLPETAFIRRPSYPGVSCRYRDGYGFTAVIRGPLYEEGNRPKEKFKVMKYFHLGHRLEDIVEREAELVEPPQEP